MRKLRLKVVLRSCRRSREGTTTGAPKDGPEPVSDPHCPFKVTAASLDSSPKVGAGGGLSAGLRRPKPGMSVRSWALGTQLVAMQIGATF